MDIEDNQLNNKDLKKHLENLQQSLEINRQRQILQKKQLDLLKENIKTIPNTDPDFALFITQKEMIQIELDQLIVQEQQLKKQISDLI